MANLSNINNILRTGSLGVGINRDPLGAFEISSATKPGIKMFNTATNGKTYEAYSDVSGNYIIYDQDADDNRFVINSAGNATFAGTVTSSAFLMSNGSFTQNGFWGTTINAGSGSFADFALLNSGTAGIMYNPTGTLNMVFQGNVGIGVAADVSVRTFIKGSDSGTNNFQILTRNSSDANILAVRNDGNVGIGTSSPGYPLEVNGRVAISSASAPQLLFFEPGRAYTEAMRLLRYEDKLSLTYGWNANEEALTVVGTGSTAGYVGIGTISPACTLTLGNATGNVAELRVLRSNSLSTTYGFINTVGGTAQLGGSSDTRIIASTGRLLFNSNSTDQISLEANGEYRLKLGSTTAGYEASMDNSNTAYRIFGSRFGGTGKYVAIWSDGANENARFYPTNTVFYKNVGIGVTGPTYPLEVARNTTNNFTHKIGNDSHSEYNVSGLQDHTVTLECPSYYNGKVIITASQTNGGGSNNIYLEGIWQNNHTQHDFTILNNIGSLTGSTLTTTVSAGPSSASGRLVIFLDYGSGSFANMVVRVCNYYSTHTGVIT